jgi:molecular chaperone GrpE
MSKLEDAQKKAKKILDDMDGKSALGDMPVENANSSQTPAGDTNTEPASDLVGELTADLQRLQAEFANYKRRAEAERSEVMDFAKARVVREFLTVRDSFEQELIHRPKSIDPTWASSIDAIRSQFDKVLASLGVERFDSVGKAFDPHLHEAVAADGAGDIVTEELAGGYKLGATVLRHAMVKVGGADSAIPNKPIKADDPSGSDASEQAA